MLTARQAMANPQSSSNFQVATTVMGDTISVEVTNNGSTELTNVKVSIFVNSIWQGKAPIDLAMNATEFFSFPGLSDGSYNLKVECNELPEFTTTATVGTSTPVTSDWAVRLPSTTIQPGDIFEVIINNTGTTSLTGITVSAPGSTNVATINSSLLSSETRPVAVVRYDNAGTFWIEVRCDEIGTPLTFQINVGTAGNPDPTRDAEVIGIQNAQIASTELFLRIQTGNIRNRLIRLRSGRETGGVRDLFNFSFSNPSRSGRNGGRHADSVASNSAVASLGSGAAASGPGPRGERFSSRAWSVWGESMVSVGSNHDGGNNDHTTYGMTIGLDRYFTQCFAAGFALGYAHDKTDVGKKGSESKGDAYTAALYASYSLPRGFFVDGSVGYSRLDLDSDRFTTLGSVTGERDGNQYFASIESGYDFRWRNLLISPYGRADASKSRLDGYAERGNAMALRIDSTDINLFSLSAGVRGEYAFEMCWGALIPSAGVEYTHNFRDTVDQKMGYVSEGSLPYLLRSKGLATNQFGASLGLEAAFRGGWTVGGEYQGVYADARRDHSFFLRVSRSW